MKMTRLRPIKSETFSKSPRSRSCRPVGSTLLAAAPKKPKAPLLRLNPKVDTPFANKIAAATKAVSHCQSPSRSLSHSVPNTAPRRGVATCITCSSSARSTSTVYPGLGKYCLSSIHLRRLAVFDQILVLLLISLSMFLQSATRIESPSCSLLHAALTAASVTEIGL